LDKIPVWLESSGIVYGTHVFATTDQSRRQTNQQRKFNRAQARFFYAFLRFDWCAL